MSHRSRNRRSARRAAPQLTAWRRAAWLVGIDWPSRPTRCCSRRVRRAFGSANSTRSVRIPQARHLTRRCGYISVTGWRAHGRSRHVRGAASRTRPVGRPQPLHGYRRAPRRSRRTRRTTSGASPFSSTRDTRKPPSPTIQVQSASDPTCPSSLFAHQEKTPSDPPMPSGSALRPGRRAGCPSQQRPT